MVSGRFRFGLEQLSSGDWLLFERLASTFLVGEFPSIRTTATASGDRGRDGEVFSVPGEEHTGFQYSVATDWSAKIRRTVQTLLDNKLDYRLIVYCTNQAIGSKVDDLKAALWKDHQILLDVRDREWFCDREMDTAEREAASAQFCRLVVDPITSARGIAENTGSALALQDGRVALVQLALNSSDTVGDKNLTKVSFDSLVQSVLIGTTQDTAVDRGEVFDRVHVLVPHGSERQVKDLIDSALTRLSAKRGPVKWIRTADTYHLSHEATKRWQESAAEYLLDQHTVEADLAAAAYGYVVELDADFVQLQAEGKELRLALEALLLQNGEQFVDAVEGGEVKLLSRQSISDFLSKRASALRMHPDDAAKAIMDVLAAPDARTRSHLVRVLNAYTLMAFLQQTPDVQKALSRVFDTAKIWLDTSAVLPLIAETLIDEPSDRLQTSLLRAAVDSGVSLLVTDGVIEEIRYHLERCVAYINAGRDWEGEVPFVYSAYMLSGRDERAFGHWLLNFRGDVIPDHDIAEFLELTYSITRRDLKELADQADQKLRAAVLELFRKKNGGYGRNRPGRGGRRRSDVSHDRLAAHDVESAVGVIQLRHGPRSALGYDAWWLTFDKTAFKLDAWLRDQLGRNAPDTPALSPDYLAQLLRLGPLRRSMSSDAPRLPLVVDVTRMESVPEELIRAARKRREEMTGLDEVRIRREVRDELHRLRTSMRSNHDYGADAEQKVQSQLANRGG
ncbi:hypothetical protein [Curtobacterium sp. PsM8]|uniref:hypothetical protein n=1 Tax=Curtobacterium sp. PsM8 TaxID=3030532 RepID=UPI00263BE5E8|nr:hypothetical protein [Curtobacterium sp. PsM8]MDN4647757.1 hypothetical protein [Curtobacterium sp. PsM8]